MGNPAKRPATSITRSLRSSLFNPAARENIRTSALDQLPKDLLVLAGSYLNLNDTDQSLIKLAKTSKTAYYTFYPAIKRILVKVLKKLIQEDNIIQVKELLRCHPYLLLREDKCDPKGLAYRGIECTPYQDIFSDPFAKEMRALLVDCFPGKTKEEKLAHALSQANKLPHSHYEQHKKLGASIAISSQFAFCTYSRKYSDWIASGYARIHLQPLRDAWMRMDLVQKSLPKRVLKILSTDVMEEKQAFENQGDLPDSHGNRHVFRHYDAIGCDLGLLHVPVEQDVATDNFKHSLSVSLEESSCDLMLIQHGEGETASYYLYAPFIPLDRDESEWHFIPIDDPKVIHLIRNGHPEANPVVNPVNFNEPSLAYSSNFDELYQFGYSKGLYLGSGRSSLFDPHNNGAGARHSAETYKALWDLGIKNIDAVLNTFEIGVEQVTTDIKALTTDYCPLRFTP